MDDGSELDLGTSFPRGLAFAAPEMLQTVLRQRAFIAAADDQRGALLAVLDDAVEAGALTRRDVHRITSFLDSPGEGGTMARQFYREALADREASQLAGVVFGMASSIAQLGGSAGTAVPRLRDADIAILIAGSMALGPLFGTGLIVGVVTRGTS